MRIRPICVLLIKIIEAQSARVPAAPGAGGWVSMDDQVYNGSSEGLGYACKIPGLSGSAMLYYSPRLLDQITTDSHTGRDLG
jgi:hypothetical protein